jgi:hypothetical protein
MRVGRPIPAGPPPPVAAANRCNHPPPTANRLQPPRGFNRIYDWSLAGALRRIFAKHSLTWNALVVRARNRLPPGFHELRAYLFARNLGPGARTPGLGL